MYDQVVKTHTIRVDNVPCEDGKHTFAQVSFNWEEYGSAQTSDGQPKPVVVILPFFLGSVRAAGHSGTDQATNKPKGVGYWDGIIGPGAPINTDTHRVISFGPLINAKCSPASINPATQKPYGSTFPNFSFRDYAVIHRQALTQLGVSQIDLLAGASMGSLQAWHLAAQDFTLVNRLMLVVPGGFMLPSKTRALAANWVNQLEADPAWNKGDYYEAAPEEKPVAVQTVLAEFWYRCQFPMDETMVYEPDQEAWAEELRKLKWLAPGITTDAIKVGDALNKLKQSQEPSAKRFWSQLNSLIKVTDHNALLWQLRTIGTFGADAVFKATDDLRFGWMGDQPIEDTRPNGQVMPKVLILYAPDDDIFTVEEVLATKKAPLGLGQQVQVVAFKANSPHASGLVSKPMEGMGQLIEAWLSDGQASQLHPKSDLKPDAKPDLKLTAKL